MWDLIGPRLCISKRGSLNGLLCNLRPLLTCYDTLRKNHVADFSTRSSVTLAFTQLIQIMALNPAFVHHISPISQPLTQTLRIKHKVYCLIFRIDFV